MFLNLDFSSSILLCDGCYPSVKAFNKPRFRELTELQIVPETRPEMQHKNIFFYFCTSLWSTKSQSELGMVPQQGVRYITVAHSLAKNQQTVKSYRNTIEKFSIVVKQSDPLGKKYL